ncbi:polyphosphate polymerase domain-containing protein [Halalkalibacterium halodurans]|uniref:polyphosphate polymerase domain-containing protein n=1 Tax=Halalkalibacterium halodurans TaxID=86665 RepID=UPI002AA9CD57|nr:polyphosphate polymerase domain-containing protein [Halalkalibacterium halodurans]MDY7224453.1 polyphosphate polymerase domain-containing protein [Halalkalibacterium halodurans]MDY7243738.1 polyphosphate polymerase domain-containing protein [Halalkalibacterium halodurans]
MNTFSLNGVKGRRELKHEMTKMDCYLLRKKLKHFMNADPYAKRDGTYLIRSVYFDNLDNKVLQQKKEGFYNRDKFRVRLYDYHFEFLNLEKKSKRNNLTFKQKCRITADEYEQVRSGDIAWMKNDSRQLIQDLYYQMMLFQLKPMTVVDYEREAFVYPYGNVRVTFDSSIKTSIRNNDVLNPHLAMVDTNPDIVILEVKYDEFLPDVIRRLLQIGDRQVGTYSKYQISRMYG